MLSKAGYLRSERGQPYQAAGQGIYGQTSGEISRTALSGCRTGDLWSRHFGLSGNKDFKRRPYVLEIGSGQLSGFFDPGQGPRGLPSNSPLASFKLANGTPVTALLLL